MARTLMLYYTFEGNTAFLADIAKENAAVTVERIAAQKEPPKQGFGKFFFGGKSALFQEDPHLLPIRANTDDFENIIIAFPVWAGTYPPAIGWFLKQHSLDCKKVFIVACSASGKAEKALAKLQARLDGNTVVESLSLVSPLRHKDEAAENMRKLVVRATKD